MSTKFPHTFGPDVQAEEVDLNDTEIIVEGERLTDDRADEYARKFEASTRRKNLIPGGKSLSGDGQTSPTLQIRVSGHILFALEEHARAAGMSKSRYARKVLEEYLATH